MVFRQLNHIRVVYIRLGICWSAYRCKQYMNHQMVFRQINHQQFDACIGWRWRRDMEYHVMRFLYMPTTSHIFGHRERWYCCGSVGCIETLEEWFRGAKRSTMTSMHGLEETDGGMFKQVCGQERIVPLDTYLRQRSPCTSYGDMSMCNNICTRVTSGLWAYDFTYGRDNGTEHSMSWKGR